MTHILWDWNGTLLDDTAAAVATFAAMLARRHKPPVSLERYRARFAFPVRPFYAEIGFDLAHEDWDAIAREYHDEYARQPKRLNGEAVAVLERARASGARQSIVSALRQDLLERDVAAYGIGGFMDFVCGVDNLDGASKTSAALSLVRRIRSLSPGDAPDLVMIGDSLHDKEVADALGARCVLCAQGSHAATRLAAVAPVGATLGEALSLALEGAGGGNGLG